MTLNWSDILFNYFIIMTNTEVAVINSAMLDRGSSFDKEPSVMDSIHKIKMYNANTFSKDPKDHEVDKELAGKLRLVEAWTGEIKYIDSWFKADILTVCKVKSGNVYVLDDFGDVVKDEKWNSKKGFFYTNEYSVFTRKTDTLGFKQMGQKPLGFYVKQDLEEMLRSKKLNGKDNPFWKQGKKKDGEPYNDTNVSDTLIIYGKFIDGPYEGDYFKFVPVSNSGYGVTYKDGKVIEADEGTFLHAMNQWLIEWNKIRKANNKPDVKSVDPSQIDMTIWFRPVEIQGKVMFVPTFTYAGLTAYRADNTQDLQYILEIQSEYLKQEFGITVLPTNFRLPSLTQETSNVNAIEIKSTATPLQDVEDVEIEQVSLEDASQVFSIEKAISTGTIPF